MVLPNQNLFFIGSFPDIMSEGIQEALHRPVGLQIRRHPVRPVVNI